MIFHLAEMACSVNSVNLLQTLQSDIPEAFTLLLVLSLVNIIRGGTAVWSQDRHPPIRIYRPRTCI